MFSKKEKKGPRSARKESKICVSNLLEDNFKLLEDNEIAKKGKEMKVHFMFVMNKFASARPLNLLIIYSIPSTSGSYNSSFWLISSDFP